MSVAVLISIHPKYCRKIFDGVKSLEIRKNFPILRPPFNCYVYETGGGGVVGEFTCRRGRGIPKIRWLDSIRKPLYPVDDEFLEKCCLTYEELENYMQGKEIIAWDVHCPVEYKEPRKLSEMKSREGKTITRAPQSWCYVEATGWEEQG